MIPGPPAAVLEAALRLGLGPRLLDTPRSRAVVERVGVPGRTFGDVTRELRRRAGWRQSWEARAAPHAAEAAAAWARGDRAAAVSEAELGLALYGLALGGDGYYFWSHMRDQRAALPTLRRLARLLRQAEAAACHIMSIPHPRGATEGLLHFPHAQEPPSGGWPALVALHPMGQFKDTWERTLAHFRQAGFATLAVDLPAHGSNFDGPRLQPDDECVGVAALEALSRRPEINAARLGVVGGSLGALFALRTAAASRLARACLAFASPFDAGRGIRQSVPGIQANFGWVIGARNLAECFEMAAQFHLRDTPQKLACPTCLVHGTQDHVCDFTAPYEIARRASAPLNVIALAGMDHEVAQPRAAEVAGPAVDWLRRTLT